MLEHIAFQALNTTTTIDVSSFIGSILINPRAYIVMLIQFLLGLGLGYVAMRALKYILGAVGIIFLGIALGVWSIGNSIYEALYRMELIAKSLWEIAYSLLTALGLLVIGPVTVGFIVGALIAQFRK
ncbi:MAG TPA: hypothetical protein EYH02_01675 [Ignisphaera aggregans]|uniref:FUN14 family protein n=1 Tax=Ignisphaera aggregans TaxID=334771 RepID=A0A833DUC3_9CREN|nr:hypothetical protein [Ignisphaera aggregans]